MLAGWILLIPRRMKCTLTGPRCFVPYDATIGERNIACPAKYRVFQSIHVYSFCILDTQDGKRTSNRKLWSRFRLSQGFATRSSTEDHDQVYPELREYFAKHRSYHQALQHAIDCFTQSGVDEAEIGAKVLFAALFHPAWTMSQLQSAIRSSSRSSSSGNNTNDTHNTLTDDQVDRFARMCSSRILHRVPIQYLIGKWDFYNISLRMRPPTLIPRPETEELVDYVIKYYEYESASARNEEESEIRVQGQKPRVPKRFIDIGCGTGAIGLSLLRAWPHSYGVLLDISPSAVELSFENAEYLSLVSRCSAVHASFAAYVDQQLSSSKQSSPAVSQEKFDMVISNPPYIPSKLRRELQVEVVEHEDEGALFGGVDGMDVIRQIIDLSPRVLKPGGCIWLEVDPTHPALIRDFVLERSGPGPEGGSRVEFVRSWKDLNGNDRFVQLRVMTQSGSGSSNL